MEPASKSVAGANGEIGKTSEDTATGVTAWGPAKAPHRALWMSIGRRY